MGDFFRALIEVIEFIWPFRIVDQWQRAGYYVAGKWYSGPNDRWKNGMPPGLKFVIPWFIHVETVDMAPTLQESGRKDITLKDGTQLSFAATATLHVVDVYKALNEIEHYKDATRELVSSYLAEKLANMDAEKFEPSKRAATMRQLREGLATEAAEFGVEITKLRFTSFVLKAKTFRLLMDQETASPW
jgi:regulator of protease activity HflC (stomatin/prohibitin superfamily)